jgi:hypothetical protein
MLQRIIRQQALWCYAFAAKSSGPTKVITRMNNLTELAIISTQTLYRISLTLSSKNMKKIITVPKVVGEPDFWIYRFEATASCCILCNAVVQNKVTLESDLSRTTAAYTIRAVTSLLPSIYDYAGAHNAANPALYNRAWPTNLLLSKEKPLFNNLEFL